MFDHTVIRVVFGLTVIRVVFGLTLLKNFKKVFKNVVFMSKLNFDEGLQSSWSSYNTFDSGAGGLTFKSRAG